MHSRFYDTDLTNAAWAWIAPVLPAARPGGRPRTTNLRAVLNAIFYLLRTGCQWRLLPREFPPCGTVYHYFQAWQNSGVWVHLHRVLYEQARRHAGRAACPSAIIMDGQSVKTTERGGARGFDAHKRCKFGYYLRIRGGNRKSSASGRTLFANGVRRSVMLFEWLSPSMGLTTFLTITRFGVSNGSVALATTRACRATPESPSA